MSLSTGRWAERFPWSPASFASEALKPQWASCTEEPPTSWGVQTLQHSCQREAWSLGKHGSELLSAAWTWASSGLDAGWLQSHKFWQPTSGMKLETSTTLYILLWTLRPNPSYLRHPHMWLHFVMKTCFEWSSTAQNLTWKLDQLFWFFSFWSD